MAFPVSRRRIALPIALLAAVAIAAGGGSSPWSVPPAARGVVAHPAGVPVVAPLEHIELVATRAQSNGRAVLSRADTRTAISVPVAGIAVAVTTASVLVAHVPALPSAPKTAPKPKGPRYEGTNHVWIPSLGISRAVHLFPCSRRRAPDNLVYRWGCAGRNNVYLMGHAYGVFKALNGAYKKHQLKVGMRAYYADGAGQVHTYEVTTWRIVDPSNSEWAIASQRRPSMTLQTCVGTLRLNVRLVEVDS
ncbi:MAG TPA: sortase [Candidatus Limnocylindrales bacterium]|nr:sortase [Candidatus Limnocylindrales bacterium]